ncbi:hypothetical protein [Ottowia testudinis]|uniref:Uncharacterized protein n=1 Tax=Ottowia testudinis TaxID=2816950 RepID=A0A975CEZ0_9BURK|nr:hypothetical protein [Ottowia testudinis]QTD43826.1 hypothetical protein J1M35_11770 [Ottowia testudinis]
MKVRYVIIIAVVLVAAMAYQFFNGYPTDEQIKKKIESILIHPDLCNNSNPEAVKFLKSIKSDGRDLYIKEKTNAMPKRIDYYVEDGEGKVIAELAYRVDGGCQGISLTKPIR